MTVNEAINYLEDAKIEFKIPKAAVAARKTNEALDMAIKALKQEPILDKIRAEIESMDFDFGDYYDHTNEIIEMVCKAIDKYKAESEVTE